MRFFILDQSAVDQAAVLSQFAQTHIYRPLESDWVPGNDSRHVLFFADGYKAVFSLTDISGVLFRQLSVSVDGKGYPQPFAVYTIAELLGFTGWNKSINVPRNWLCMLSEKDRCVWVAQKMGPADA